MGQVKCILSTSKQVLSGQINVSEGREAQGSTYAVEPVVQRAYAPLQTTLDFSDFQIPSYNWEIIRYKWAKGVKGQAVLLTQLHVSISLLNRLSV